MSANGPPGRVAGVGRRFAAVFIDAWLVVGPVYLVAWLLGSNLHDFSVVQAVLTATVVLVYEVGAVSRWGMTLGKRAVGIKAVGADGRPPRVVHSTQRYIVKSLFPLILLLALMGVPTSGISVLWQLGILAMLLGRSDRRGPHDLAGRTWVVAMNDEPLARTLARSVPPVQIADDFRFTGRKRRYTRR